MYLKSSFILFWFLVNTTLLALTLPNDIEISLILKGDFTILKDHTQKSFRIIQLGNKTDVLHIFIYPQLDAKQADELIQNKRFMLEGLYRQHRTGYPGKLTHAQECPTKFHPKVIQKYESKKNKLGYKLFANKRYVYGGCSDDVNTYQSAYVLQYCPNKKKIYEIKYYTSKKKPQNDLVHFIQSINCK